LKAATKPAPFGAEVIGGGRGMRKPSEQLRNLIDRFPRGLSFEKFFDLLDTYTWPDSHIEDELQEEIKSFDWQYLWGEWYSRF
jgi:hypothetical protein